MAKLIYITNTSLDGCIEDASGALDWSNPDQIFTFITGLIRPLGTFLYGRRLYETMAYWERPAEQSSPDHLEFARVWQNAEKIVFSRTLSGATTQRTRVERNFDVDAVRTLKRESAHDIGIGGAALAAAALDAGLVDECQLFVHPIVLGGGKPAFRRGLRRSCELLETRAFGDGVIYVRYRLRGSTF